MRYTSSKTQIDTDAGRSANHVINHTPAQSRQSARWLGPGAFQLPQSNSPRRDGIVHSSTVLHLDFRAKSAPLRVRIQGPLEIAETTRAVRARCGQVRLPKHSAICSCVCGCQRSLCECACWRGSMTVQRTPSSSSLRDTRPFPPATSSTPEPSCSRSRPKVATNHEHRMPARRGA